MAKQTKDTNSLPDDARAQLGGLQQANRRSNRHKGEYSDYSTVDAELLLGAVKAITGHGFAVQFGYTKDRGAFVVRIVGDGEPYNDFVRPTEDINTYLEALTTDYTDNS